MIHQKQRDCKHMYVATQFQFCESFCAGCRHSALPRYILAGRDGRAGEVCHWWWAKKRGQG